MRSESRSSKLITVRCLRTLLRLQLLTISGGSNPTCWLLAHRFTIRLSEAVIMLTTPRNKLQRQSHCWTQSFMRRATSHRWRSKFLSNQFRKRITFAEFRERITLRTRTSQRCLRSMGKAPQLSITLSARLNLSAVRSRLKTWSTRHLNLKMCS